MDSDTDAPGGRRKFDPELERMLLEGEIFVEQTWLKLRLMADHWPAIVGSEAFLTIPATNVET